MKKIMTMLALIVLASVSADAQMMKIYKGGKLVAAFKGDDADKVVIDRPKSFDGEAEGHQYVDLGLPSGNLWAVCNMGAASPEQSGDYIAWAERKAKDDYSFESYLWSSGRGWYNVDRYTFPDGMVSADWYDTNRVFRGDNKKVLDKSDDAAYAEWWGEWHIPAAKDFTELVDECLWSCETVGDIRGYRFVGPNGNSIFLPMVGNAQGLGYYYNNEIGLYWSSELASTSYQAQCLTLLEKEATLDARDRCEGLSIRPVIAGPAHVREVVLSSTSIRVDLGYSVQLIANVVPAGVPNPGLKWSSSIPSIATVDADGTVTAVSEGVCTVTCTATDGSGVSATCKVTVTMPREAVDLGLPSGTLWATCNVGAESPEQYGDYFAWGETVPKNKYDWSTYKWCNGSESTLTKYCSSVDYWDSSLGTSPDQREVLAPIDDAATVNWGNTWQMPSYDQFHELISSQFTILRPDTINGIIGYLIVSKSNGKSIFLPAAGEFKENGENHAGWLCNYWSNNINANSSSGHLGLYTTVEHMSNVYAEDRCDGLSVRPVRVRPVSSDPIPVWFVELNYKDIKLRVTTSKELKAYVYPSDAANKGLVWSSSDPSIAKVSADGVVTAVSAGTCYVKCTTIDGSGAEDACTVTVDDDHDYVDLGLPSGTLWATCNVGAETFQEVGDLFAWGETQSTSVRGWAYYKWCNGDYNKLTKYCNDSNYWDTFLGAQPDNKTILDPEDDAATVNWGPQWQMPTLEQVEELLDRANTWRTWTEQGCFIRSRKNDKGIFLPINTTFSSAVFWTKGSKRSFPTDPYLAWCFTVDKDWTDVGSEVRYCDRAVRPVRVFSEPVIVTGIELRTKLNLTLGKTRQLKANVLPITADNPCLEWRSSNPSVAKVDAQGNVTAVSVGRCLVTCYATDGSDVTADCMVNVTAEYEYVDLGLPSGTLWAKCNVGAENPDEYGDYFAWGETEPKDLIFYDRHHYKWMNANTLELTKYCNADNKTTLDPEDDAATVNWGSEWQMPSVAQMRELVDENYITSEYTTINGVWGRLFTSKSNGNYIFLPSAGYIYAGKAYDYDGGFHYLPCSLYTLDKHFVFNPFGSSTETRSNGNTVRPVRVKK